MTKKMMYTFGRAALACLLALTVVVGAAATVAPSASAATSDYSVQVTPIQVEHPEKPYVTIETNLVVDATGKPTGYVEMALKVTTPTLYYADRGRTILRYEGDELDATHQKFDPTNHATYATTRQTTFRNIGITLEYNSSKLLPVSWEHEDGDSIEYPDFFFDNYGYELVEELDSDGNTETKIYKTSELAAEREQITNESGDVVATAIEAQPYLAGDVMADFNSKDNFSVAVPVLQDSTDITSAVAFVQGSVKDPQGAVIAGKSLLSLEVDSSVDIAFPEETTLAVVRFRYLGEVKDIESAIDVSGEIRTVDTAIFTSNHDEVSGGTATSLLRFAPESGLSNSPVRQILHYTSGYYVGHGPEGDYLGEGANAFYSTKYIYNGTETELPEYTDSNFITTITGGNNYIESTVLKDKAGGGLDLPWTGNPEGNDADSPYISATLADNRDTVRAKAATGTASGPGYYSYTSNLLFTSDTQSFIARSNVRFTMAAEESYNAGGGTDIDNVATIVFLDWDDSILGALSVVKGDTRAAVEAYVENFIHPSLRASTYKDKDDTESQDMLKNLATSLERKYTYAGKYPSTDENNNGLFEVPVDTNGNGTIDEGEWNDAELGTNYFPDDYIVTTSTGESAVSTDLSGSSYPLTNKLDYAFLRRPVKDSEEVNDKYTNDNGETVPAIEWTTGVIDYTGTATADTNDDYFYIHGWALVAQRERESNADNPNAFLADINPESVWTTFSSSGELSHVRLPGYDTDGDYNGIDKYNANVIASALDLDPSSGTTNIFGGAESEQSGLPISFVTYADSNYFAFADFSEVDADEIYVKACYEPGESVNWNGYYSISSATPYYVRYGAYASTNSGIYAIIFDYSRVTDNNEGVLRARSPYIKVQYTQDEKGAYGDNFYVGIAQNSTDIISAELTPSSSLTSLKYYLVETYGYGNFVQSGDRSVMKSESFILDNFSYCSEDENESFENGYWYENRFGTVGFVYSATLRQIMEEGTIAAQNDMAIGPESTTYRSQFVNQYLSDETLIDLNLRITHSGASADGTGLTTEDGSKLVVGNRAKNAIYDAIYQVLANNATEYIGEDGVVDLDWHQLQYHILNWDYTNTGGGILLNGDILAPEQCNSYAWCRQDECSEKVTVAVSDLTSALEAIKILNDSSADPEKVSAAENALGTHLLDILSDNYILDAAKVNANSESVWTREDAKDKGAYTVEWSAVADVLYELIKANGMDCSTLTAVKVQDWVATYDESTNSGSYRDSEEDVGDNIKVHHLYWWQSHDYKQYIVEFDEATEQDAAELFVAAAVSELVYGNEIAWVQLSVDDMNDMRFSSDGRGDFFDVDTYDGGAVRANGVDFVCEGVKEKYDAYLSAIYDTSGRQLVLGEFLDVQDAINIVRALVEEIGADGLDESGAVIWKSDVEQLVLEELGYNETETDDYSWYQIQYCLLNSSNTAGAVLAANPEYYDKTYWWKDAPTDTNNNGKLDEDDVRNANMRVSGDSIDEYAYTGVTLENLQQILRDYIDGKVTSTQFAAWFTVEVAADLILRENTSGAFIESEEVVESRLLSLATSFVNNGGSNFSELTWSQVQYYILPNTSYLSTYRAQKEFTYTGRCFWGSGTEEEDSNRWRESKKEPISDIVTLINVINGSGGNQSLNDVAWEDLEDGLYLKYLGSDTESSVLSGMKNAYEDALGSGAWNLLATRLNSDSVSDSDLENAWYMVQYYLDKGELVISESQFAAGYVDSEFIANDVLANTGTTGKTLYWWKDGWSGVDRFSGNSLSGLVETVTSGVSARIDWLTGTTGGVPNMQATESGTLSEAQYKVNFRNFTRNIKGENGETISWTSDAMKNALIVMMKVEAPGNTNEALQNWWSALQFAALHYSQGGEDTDTIAQTIAIDESSAFYWWYNNSTEAAVTVDGSVFNGLSNNIDDATLNAAVQALAEAVLYKLATGHTVNDAYITAEYIETLNIRVPSAGAGSRFDLDSYVTTKGAEKVLEAFEALVKRVYEANANAPVGGWDYAYERSGYDVYTYHEAAYDAVCNLTGAQVQYWFYTYFTTDGVDASYNVDETTAAGYWWLTSATPKVDDSQLRAEAEQMFIDLIALSVEYNEDETRTAYRAWILNTKLPAMLSPENLSQYFDTDSTAALATMLKNAQNFYTKNSTLKPTTYMQCRVLIGKGTALNATAAAKQGTNNNYNVPSYMYVDGVEQTFSGVTTAAIEKACGDLYNEWAAAQISLTESAAGPVEYVSGNVVEDNAADADNRYEVGTGTDDPYVNGEDAVSVETAPAENPTAAYMTLSEQAYAIYAVVPAASDNKMS